MSGSREKLRAVFLAFVMVASVFGATIAFTGSATALSSSDVTVANDPVVLGSEEEPLGDSGQPFNITENGSNEFGASGSAAVTLPNGVTFDQSSSNLQFRQVSSGSVSNVRFTDSQTLEFDYSGFDSGQNDSVLFSKLNLSISTNAADPFTVDVRVGAISTTKDINTAAAGSTVESSTTIARGQNSAGSAQINITATKDGLHEQNNNISVTIPSSQQDKLSFDTSTTPSVTDGNGDAIGGSVTPVVTANEITFNVTGDDLDTGDGILISSTDIAFNTTGTTDDATDPSFTSALNYTVSPSQTSITVEQQTGTVVTVGAPTAALDGNPNLAAGTNQQTTSANVTVTDTSDTVTGGAIAAGTNVTAVIPNSNGITFDQSQTLDASFNASSNGVAGSATFVDNKTITVAITASTDASSNDDKLDIGSAGGKLAFNVTAASQAQNVNISVETNATTTGNQSIVRNTSVGSSNALDVSSPAVSTNDADTSAQGGGADLTLDNDANGETQVDPDSNGANNNDFVIQTQVDGDIESPNSDTNITITIPSSSAVTFDKSAGVSSSTNLSASVQTPTIVDANTINVTVGSDSSPGSQNDEQIHLTGIQYNITGDTSDSTQLTATVNRTGVSVTSSDNINATLATPDAIDVNADRGNDNDFDDDGINLDKGSAETGNTVTGQVAVLNATPPSGSTDGSKSGANTVTGDFFGGETVNLAVTDSPSGGSASLNTTSVQTAEDATADFDITLGSQQGDYNVTASLASNSSVNATLQYTAGSGDVSQFNTTGQEDALIDTTGLSTDPSESTAQAVYKVRLEDANGNLNTSAPQDTEVKFSLSVSDSAATIENVSTGLANDGTAIGNTTPESGGTFTYNYTEDSNNPGIFHVFVSDPTAGDTDLTVQQSGTSDSGTVTFFDTPASVAVSFNNSNPSVGDTVAATATPQTSAGNPVTVGQLSVNFNSTNQTVATSADGSFPITSTTDANGDALTNVSIDANGTTDINATTEGVSGISTITVEEEQLPTATVTFGDEDGLTVQNGSTSVDVASARFDGTEDFVIVVHRASPGDDGVVDGPSEIGDKIGSSDVLSGNVSDVSVNLTKNLDEGGNTQLTENQTLIAMVHFANESRPGDRNFDMPIVRSGSPVFDQAEITIAPESPLEGAAGDFDTDGNGDIDIRELGDAGQAFLDDELTIQELGEIGQEFLS